MAIFNNGDYAICEKFITVGDDLDRKHVLDRIFEYKPPILLRDCSYDDTILLSLGDGTFLGPFRVSSVALTAYGVELSVSDYSRSNFSRINGYRNFGKTAEAIGKCLYVPYNCVVLKLDKNLSGDCESKINEAVCKRQLAVGQYLGAELNLGYDGVEFSINGSPVGMEPHLMAILVNEEGIEPIAAENFIKQAKITKYTKVYLTKKAADSSDYSPAAVPQYGLTASNDAEQKMAPNGAWNSGGFVSNVQQSMELGDAQVAEATIISELLQIPDMYEQIGEYLPNLEEAIDKLGRILFISRIHIDQLARKSDPDNIFAFLAGLKSTYRLLGDNFIKLQEMVAAAPAAGVEENE